MYFQWFMRKKLINSLYMKTKDYLMCFLITNGGMVLKEMCFYCIGNDFGKYFITKIFA